MAKKNSEEFVAITALIVSMIIWSVSGIAIKHALAVLPPFTMIVLRFVPSVLLMLIIGLIQANCNRNHHQKQSRQHRYYQLPFS